MIKESYYYYYYYFWRPELRLGPRLVSLQRSPRPSSW